MISRVAPLQLGCRVQFTDRWQGTVTSFEATDEWVVINITVTVGVFKRTSVKLPFERATGWSDDHLSFGCTSEEALGRQIAPVAAPARPLSKETPLSAPGARLAGAVIQQDRLVVSELIISRGLGKQCRIAAADVGFEGKVMTLGAPAESLPEYHPDAELEFLVREALAADPFLTPDDRRCLALRLSGGRVTLEGNVRTKIAREHAERAVARVPGVIAVENRAISDIELEPLIGQALQAAGVAHGALVYVRSSLGQVTLFGTAPSARAADDIIRVIGRAPGVRGIQSRLEVTAGARPAA